MHDKPSWPSQRGPTKMGVGLISGCSRPSLSSGVDPRELVAPPAALGHCTGPTGVDYIVLFIHWTQRRKRGRTLTRIISARRATPQERKHYAKEISKRQASPQCGG